jgi:hypothetical protein
MILCSGASGALFGIIAIELLNVLYTWRTLRTPGRDLLFIFLDIAVAFVLGLLPGLDNFSHIGGFLMGLALGLCILHSPDPIRERTGMDEPPYRTIGGSSKDGNAQDSGRFGAIGVIAKNPIGFFKNRRAWWWAWWLIRAVTLAVVLIGFILLLNNFYVARKECSWCYHLSCLVSYPIHKFAL